MNTQQQQLQEEQNELLITIYGYGQSKITFGLLANKYPGIPQFKDEYDFRCKMYDELLTMLIMPETLPCMPIPDSTHPYDFSNSTK